MGDKKFWVKKEYFLAQISDLRKTGLSQRIQSYNMRTLMALRTVVVKENTLDALHVGDLTVYKILRGYCNLCNKLPMA